ncbi:T9SS-dependent M36 family metallopeptidase [Kaistella polysaccharea]|uniref:T9SS-dependent M36 family metallopeptidase n=1 Tax=Kaistella polysaccharea TaxID=2878534 RepID=UPI001CF46088|nr:T9SS-dependent M36 family metallopeptidase [Kaistella polysaccharea]
MKNRNLPLKIATVCFLISFGNAKSQDFKTLIQEHISAKGDFLKRNLNSFEIINEDFSKSMGGDVIKIQQSYNGLPVFNSFGTALIKNNKIAYLQESFVKNFVNDNPVSTAKFNKSVFENVANQLSLKDSSQYQVVGFGEKKVSGVQNVKSRLCYYQTESSDLTLSYEFVFPEKGTSNYWNIVADATTGEILSKQNLTLSCNFSHDAPKHDYSAHDPAGFDLKFSAENSATQSLALASQSATYNVFALPIESPSHGSRSIVSNPWFTDASPDGWHRVSGSEPKDYTVTRGNNVYAYDDIADADAPGASPDGGPNLKFDFPFVLNANIVNFPAATTNLFYINNKVHDIFYRLGFTEKARNFQAYNFGKGGAQGDYVLAEAQDGAGRNNANFATPPDGTMPIMQMYLWDPSLVERVFYNLPTEAVNRTVQNRTAAFGSQLTPSGVTADVVLSPVIDACTALPKESLAGKIGLIERGSCDFVTKVKNAQVAGARAVIIYNLPGSALVNMGGEDISIYISTVLIKNEEGEYIKGLLQNNKKVNITLKYDPAAQATIDGSFDNGIVIHEYGHGISNRNTGNGYSCLNPDVSSEQMGEGWSDFFTLMLTNKPGDTKNVPRGIGTFASSQAITGTGIRPALYSPDIGINNFKYGATKGMEYTNDKGVLVPDVHSIGFIWATMLWDLHWKYAEKYGYSADVMANSTNGSTRILQLVTDALKLQVCNPTFIEGRDAILQAELNTTKGEDKCMIWSVFAKRGLGVKASAGLKGKITDQVQDSTMPDECAKYGLATDESAISAAISLYPNPAKNEFFLKSSKNTLGKINVEIYDASGKLVSGQKISASEAVNTQKLPNGLYLVKVEGLGVQYSSKLIIKK